MLPLLFSLILGVDSHGQMVIPPSRNGGRLETGTNLSASHWFVTGVQIPGDATLPAEFITIGSEEAKKGYKKNPWRAPGTAEVLSPCGTGCANGKDHECANKYPTDIGKDGRDLPKTKRVVWQQDGIEEVAWAPSINHGGGYAYRLCPTSQGRPDEACFQKLEHHLEFVDDFHTIHWTDTLEEETISAKRTKVGTFPAGSQWSMNPIPTMQGTAAFPDPCSLHPCGGYPGPFPDEMSFSIKDRVKVPADLTPGDYTLSWRYDCEVTQQVWTNCADITIASHAPLPTPTPTPTPAPIPTPAPTPQPECPGQSSCGCSWTHGGSQCNVDDGTECWCRCCCQHFSSHSCKWHGRLTSNITIV